MNYSEFLTDLNGYAEADFAAFQRKLISTKQEILGVRTPRLRKIAKEYSAHFQEIFFFPDDIYEVTFVKLAMAAKLPYETFLSYVEPCVAKIDNWATCDTFKAKCIQTRREEFLPIFENLFRHGGEFYERYVLVTLLSFYVEDRYLPIIIEYIKRANVAEYYVHMAAAWLTAEILVKAYDRGVAFLQQGALDKKTHNKAIQKAIESYRLTIEQKERLRSLKR